MEPDSTLQLGKLIRGQIQMRLGEPANIVAERLLTHSQATLSAELTPHHPQRNAARRGLRCEHLQQGLVAMHCVVIQQRKVVKVSLRTILISMLS